MDELKQITTRYLLGELTEQEQAALEERYLSDPQVFNQVLQVESELVDAYARDQLSSEMRERFENSYLKHPARRERVEFARALTTRIDERQAFEQPAVQFSWKQRLLAIFGGSRPALRFATALTIVLIAVAGIWMFFTFRGQRQQREAAQIQTQRENQEEQIASQQPAPTPQLPPETAQASPAPITNSAPPTVSLALTVGGVRSADGGPTQTLVIPRDTTQAQILLNLKDDTYPRYRVSLRQIGGPEIFTQTNIRPRNTKAGARFVFKVPAGRFSSGDYALTLSGISSEGEVDDLNKSLFRVEKR